MAESTIVQTDRVYYYSASDITPEEWTALRQHARRFAKLHPSTSALASAMHKLAKIDAAA